MEVKGASPLRCLPLWGREGIYEINSPKELPVFFPFPPATRYMREEKKIDTLL
jgi:hypothetical protein